MPKEPQVSGPEPRYKTLRTKVKAPEYEDDGDQDRSGWSVEDLKYLYHRKKLRDFVHQGPVMNSLKLKRIAKPNDPVTAPANVTNKLDVVTVLIKLLKAAGMIPGSFEMCSTWLKILVGKVPQIADPVSSPPIDVVDNLTVSSHYASAAEDGSDTSS
ncbi:LOW QUALITY PROTEIN: hypothetical protein PHMEG_00014228 [Phytophthora megakarya]|uniref:Uncharacterized protein n=1 Tax=Phytophthora megakarya TaxID=4795 RepID=A0A225W5W1_9STRA|nr:LOW QUALITY PROTEIN: hypothetical protein PHMEG_00014228 [Phytophthora megakarya]